MQGNMILETSLLACPITPEASQLSSFTTVFTFSENVLEMFK